ncbi:hypothetical protein ACI5KX_10520 [Erythrobacter sp. GH1-10]|uniref:hypothetical protein n=1 Tax=Erythrobacter sp. GH1-10 TaxID=3349334 RepID=UPI003877E25A
MSGVRIVTIAGASALLCACTTTPPAAVTTYEVTDCVTTPSFAEPIDLTLAEGKNSLNEKTRIHAETPCLELAGERGPYVVYRLPTRGVVEIGSQLEAARVMAVNVALLDSEGEMLREFDRDQYNFRSGMLSVQFEPQVGEAYALVTTNNAMVGDGIQGVETGISSTYIATGYGGFIWFGGSEAAMDRGYSYAGELRARVMVRPEDRD